MAFGLGVRDADAKAQGSEGCKDHRLHRQNFLKAVRTICGAAEVSCISMERTGP
jgi:hypothetical protein